MRTRLFVASLLSAVLAAGMAFGQPAKGETVKIYAAAVMKTPLTAMAAEYEKATGNKTTVIFDTAGATEQRFRADPEATLLITATPLIRNAESSGALKEGTATLLGSTVAGVAVPPGNAKPDVSSPDKLKAALLAAKRIAVSDPARGATVGTHFMKVIEGLGVKDQVMPKITFAADGVETMRIVMEKRADLGVSQSSEIVQASPDALAGPFPKEYALNTDFSLWHRNSISAGAKDFVVRLTSSAGRQKLAADGVMPPAAR
jgi:molybdate transport system substrate-binding protein